MKNNKVFFRSKAEAEAESGYFSISSLMISSELGEKISEYLARNDLITFSQPNKSKSANNSYTLNFTLKQYHDVQKARAYISTPGAIGYYKHLFKGGSVSLGSKDDKFSSRFRELETKEFEKFKILQDRSPTLEEMYYWIVQKYRKDIIWMDYSCSNPKLKLFLDESDDDRPF